MAGYIPPKGLVLGCYSLAGNQPISPRRAFYSKARLENMAEIALEEIPRLGLDDFDPDPRNLGGVSLFKDAKLAEAIRALGDHPASTRTSPNTHEFSDHTLRINRQLYDRTGWDIVSHFVLAIDVGESLFPIHTDWEGATFADTRTFTLWVPLSHFEEPHLMLLRPQVWPPPNCEFHLDENGLYGRTMLHDDIFRLYSTYPDLSVLELSLKKDEILAFNGAIPHFTHPDTASERRSISFRCPSNRGSLDEPQLHLNMTSPYARALALHSETTPLSPLLSTVDARSTPKGYYEVDFAVRRVERKARARHYAQRVRRFRGIPTRWRKGL